jgi:hypothetical protein
MLSVLSQTLHQISGNHALLGHVDFVCVPTFVFAALFFSVVSGCTNNHSVFRPAPPTTPPDTVGQLFSPILYQSNDTVGV